MKMGPLPVHGCEVCICKFYAHLPVLYSVQ